MLAPRSWDVTIVVKILHRKYTQTLDLVLPHFDLKTTNLRQQNLIKEVPNSRYWCKIGVSLVDLMGFTESTSSTPTGPQPRLPRRRRSAEWASSTTTSLASSPSRSVSVSSGGSSVRCWRSAPHGVAFSRWNESDHCRCLRRDQLWPTSDYQGSGDVRICALRFCLFSVGCHLLPRVLCDAFVLSCRLFFLQLGP